jgi:hypothetical protein
MTSFETCRDFCALHGLILTPKLWDGSKEQLIHKYVYTKSVDALKDELRLREEAVVINERFASLLQLDCAFFDQLSDPMDFTEREYDLLSRLRHEEGLDDALDALQPSEYFEKYSSIWCLLCQRGIAVETVIHALRTLGHPRRTFI